MFFNYITKISSSRILFLAFSLTIDGENQTLIYTLIHTVQSICSAFTFIYSYDICLL